MGVALVSEKTVDILLAAYNGKKYLPQLLQSLAKQFYGGFRVLMHDDGSSDGTEALLKEIAQRDSRFTMSRCNETGLGAAGSFMALLKESDADFCCLCDQDDVWSPDHISLQLHGMEKLTGQYGADVPLLVYGDCALIDGDGKLMHPSFCMKQGWKREALPLRMLLVQNNAPGCTMMLNRPLRQLVSEHGRPDEMFMHDWFIAQTAAAMGAMYFEQLPLVDYRQHGDNVLGASRDGVVRRGAKALARREAARERIRLTYRQAALLKDCYAGVLSAAALQ